MKLIFEKSAAGRKGVLPPGFYGAGGEFPEACLRAEPAELPEVSELDAVRHFTGLQKMNFSVDTNFYPLGSCTMKHNPAVLEAAASLKSFTGLHPFFGELDAECCQGALEILHRMQKLLSEITGMDETSLQPLAGAHGELAGMMIVRAYHEKKSSVKDEVIIPDTSHGTNPASAALAGFRVVAVQTAPDGRMDMKEFSEKLGPRTACVIMTVPNTLGLYNRRIKEIADMAHRYDALMYCDGANMNAILGKVRPGDAGFDIMHTNLHKTFAAPHGGGGPGSGPVSVKQLLAGFLPSPRITRSKEKFFLSEADDSIGQLAPFYGNFAVILKAFTYILIQGADGLTDASEKAVLNANYVMARLREFYEIPYGEKCMHEFVLSAARQAKNGVSAMDIAKFLIENGVHPPTVYFPLIVREAMMIEPTETESRETLDGFIELMIRASRLAVEKPAIFEGMPASAPVTRPDEALAARRLDVAFIPEK